VEAAVALEPCLPYALPATCHSWQVSASTPCHGAQLTAAEGAAWAAVLPSLAGHVLTLGLRALEVAAAEGALTASSAEAEVEVEALQPCHLSLQATKAAALSLRLLPLQVVAAAAAVPWLQTLAAAAEG